MKIFTKVLYRLFACILFTVFICSYTYAQTDKLKGWHLLDFAKDSFYGISLNKAYDFLKEKNKRATPIIVAVIDGGIDTSHEDLKNVLWHNPKEIANNGIDDDHNGYIDDVYGWNFLGNKDGSNVKKASDEKTRVYHLYKEKFAGKEIDTSQLTTTEKYQYSMWKRSNDELSVNGDDQVETLMLEATAKAIKRQCKIIGDEFGRSEFTLEELEKFEPKTKQAKDAKYAYVSGMKMLSVDSDEKNTNIIKELEDYIENKKALATAKTTPPPSYRSDIVKDDDKNINDKYYGNKDVMGPDAMHGTHVSGIIAADRNNHIGVNGVADNVKILTVRAVPDGDEYDKDIALGIFYAVDNGAKVINMSFGKAYSPGKNWIDSAVRYAEKHDVLLVHAAGNESYNIDEKNNYPCPDYLNSTTKASNFITVGASSDLHITPNSLAADFSNYGKQNVDVFAPGVKIYSTLPGGNQYGNLQGTSMASPVVAGIAALIRSYYPSLTAQQVKKCIEESVMKIADSIPCMKPGTKVEADMNGNVSGDKYKISFSTLSKTGGIANAYNAIRYADTLAASLNEKNNSIKKKKN
ncbi:MAG: S8 family peptidase [Sphingobacteriia bacterium]|nr:S8 family peptidase [Sphingobacteriia bacterium]